MPGAGGRQAATVPEGTEKGLLLVVTFMLPCDRWETACRAMCLAGGGEEERHVKEKEQTPRGLGEGWSGWRVAERQARAG